MVKYKSLEYNPFKYNPFKYIPFKKHPPKLGGSYSIMSGRWFWGMRMASGGLGVVKTRKQMSYP